jgi:ectoine hydroxylase-related dioxygenase (phytanoyl-CoA dioxygenase family)
MSSGAAPSLPQDVVDRYRDDGIVILRGPFSEWVAPLRAGVERLMRDPSPLERTVRPQDGSAPFFQDFCNWRRIAEFHAFVYESPAAPLAARLMGSRTARFFHDHVLVKEPGTSVPTPWHQDQPYYCVEGRQSVSFWIALDPVTRETVPEYVAGSHRWDRDFRPTRFDGTPLYAQDDFESLPDIDAQRGALRIVGEALEPGDALAFHFRTVHGAPANRSSGRRRGFSTRWVGDDAVYADRGGRTSPPFPDLGLQHGDPLDAPEFPIIFRS